MLTVPLLGVLSDSVRAFKEKMKLGQFKDVDPEEKKRQEAEKLQLEKEEEEKAKTITTGNRLFYARLLALFCYEKKIRSIFRFSAYFSLNLTAVGVHVCEIKKVFAHWRPSWPS